MKNKYKQIAFIIILLIAGCTLKNNKREVLPEKIKVDIKNLENLELTKLSNDIKLINLELSEKNIIGDVDILKNVNDKFYIYDESSKSLYCNSSEGKLIFQINRIGRGPGEIGSLESFLVKSPIDEIIIIDGKNGKILTFTNDGKFVSEKKYHFISSYIEYLGDNKYVVYANYYKNNWENAGNIFFMDSNFNVINNFLPINERFEHMGLTYSVPLTNYKNNSYLLSEIHNNNIYVIDTSGVRLKYEIDFFSNNVSESIINILPENHQAITFEIIQKQKEYFDKLLNSNYCHFIESFFESNVYRGFLFVYKTGKRVYLENKTEAKKLLVGNLLLDNSLSVPGKIILLENNFLYISMGPEDLKTYFRELTQKYSENQINKQNTNYKYLKTLYNLAKSKTLSSNPVIMKISLNF